MYHFPSTLFDFHLSEEDFIRFRSSFVHLITEKIPTAKDVRFSIDSEDSCTLFDDVEKEKQIQEAMLRVVSSGTAETVQNDCLVIPFSLSDHSVVAATVIGVDPILVSNVGNDWLVEIHNTLLEGFNLVRHAHIDPETGLYNAISLFSLLESIEDYSDVNLIMLEMHPKRKAVFDSIFSARKCGSLLSIFTENRFPIHHIGHLVYCIVCAHPEKEFAPRFSSSMVAWLRRENFQRVHVGCCRAEEVVERDSDLEEKKQQMLDGAWTSLKIARNRGPFSLYNHCPREYQEEEQQKARSKKALLSLQRKWKALDYFSLIQFQQENVHIVKMLEYLYSLVDPNLVFEEKGDVYVLLPNEIDADAVDWVKKFVQKIEQDCGNKYPISAGISCFPYGDFKKSEMVDNCRKALVHGSFFGPGFVTVFDHISLNISGDNYFGKGDMVMALKEYKRGFACCHTDVNLLNSLGVTYGMIDKHKLAIESFRHALILEPDNYMALYNLGLAEELKMNEKEALRCFEKALEVYAIENDTSNNKQDLLFRLGRLYCHSGLFRKSKDILLEWYRKNDKDSNRGRALRLIGESWYGLGEKEEAVKWLQRAAHFDEFDSRALSLLGMLYMEQGEGDDIALSLCEKSVELEPGIVLYQLRLAKILVHLSRLDESMEYLVPCLRNSSTRDEARLQMGIIQHKKGEGKKARRWFNKLVNQEGVSSSLIKIARQYVEIQ